MPPTPLAKAAVERAPATRTSSVNEGVEALTQMVRLKTTRSPQQRRPSSTGYAPKSWRDDVTIPGARMGRGSPPMWAERERALWPTPTSVRQQLGLEIMQCLHFTSQPAGHHKCVQKWCDKTSIFSLNSSYITDVSENMGQNVVIFLHKRVDMMSQGIWKRVNVSTRLTKRPPRTRDGWNIYAQIVPV